MPPTDTTDTSNPPPPTPGTAEAEGQKTLADAKQAETDALAKLQADPKNTALAETATKAAQLAEAIGALVSAPPELTNEELIELAKQQRRIDAGLGVVASITGALYALHQVLTDATFQALLNKDLPAAVKKVMTTAVQKVLAKLNPLFEGFRKFQQPDLRDKTNNFFDASVHIAYALVELSEPEEQDNARKSADNVALVMGLVKKAAPLVIACIDLIACCLSALGDNEITKSTPTAATTEIGQKLNKALVAKTMKRDADRAKNVKAGQLLLVATEKRLQLTAGDAG